MRTEHPCEHGADSTRHTRLGEPACPLCRITYKALANLRPPQLDYAALAAHDPPERDRDP
jgi:hypothetical protein